MPSPAKTPLRRIKTKAEYDALPESAKDALFAFSFFLGGYSEARKNLFLATIGLLLVAIITNGYISNVAPTARATTIALGLKAFTVVVMIAVLMSSYRYARDLRRRSFAIRFIERELGIDARSFDIDEIYGNGRHASKRKGEKR